VIYLIFNEGYATSSGKRLTREDLCIEAIRLGRLLDRLMPDEPEAKGLLALMLLIHARHPARTTPEGELALLADQDRQSWDRRLIAEGQALVQECLRRDQPGPYQIQAAINAVHSDAPTFEATDWAQILQLYDQLLAATPGPIVSLHRAVAVAEVHGPTAALPLVDELKLEHYYLGVAVSTGGLAPQPVDPRLRAAGVMIHPAGLGGRPEDGQRSEQRRRRPGPLPRPDRYRRKRVLGPPPPVRAPPGAHARSPLR
jgi:predicted RNA polymerase sigma factor